MTDLISNKLHVANQDTTGLNGTAGASTRWIGDVNEGNKPNFAAWNMPTLVSLTTDIWDDNIKLREAVEQLRMDNKDLSKLLRQANIKDASA